MDGVNIVVRVCNHNWMGWGSGMRCQDFWFLVDLHVIYLAWDKVMNQLQMSPNWWEPHTQLELLNQEQLSHQQELGLVRWPAIAISGLLEMRQLNSITQSCPTPHSAQTEMQRLKSFAQLILAWWSRRTLSLCSLDMSSIWSYHNEGLALWGGISLQSSRRAIQFYGACWNFVLS